MPKKGNVKKIISKHVKKNKQQKGGIFGLTMKIFSKKDNAPPPTSPPSVPPPRTFTITLGVQGKKVRLLESEYRMLAEADRPPHEYNSYSDTFFSKIILDYLISIKSNNPNNPIFSSTVQYNQISSNSCNLIFEKSAAYFNNDKIKEITDQQEIDLDSDNKSLYTFGLWNKDERILCFPPWLKFTFTMKQDQDNINIQDTKNILFVAEGAFQEYLEDKIDKIYPIISAKKSKKEEITTPGGKKHSKKEVLGKTIVIYKIQGDRKEYVKHKGKLTTVKDYKALMKQKAKQK